MNVLLAIEAAAGVVLALSLALVARSTITDPGARGWAIGGAAIAGLAAPVLAATATIAAAAALAAAALPLRLAGRPALRAGASALSLATLALSPPIGIASVGLAALRERRVWAVALEVALAAALLIGLERASAARPLVLLVVACALVALAATRLPALGRIPPRRDAVGLAWLGAAAGVLALLAAQERLRLLPSDALWGALLATLPAALFGLGLAATVVGGLALLSVRDEARVVMVAALIGAALVALFSLRAATLALLPGAVVAFGAGAARLVALRRSP